MFVLIYKGIGEFDLIISQLFPYLYVLIIANAVKIVKHF
nr:MAG TPA: INTERLEUKIN-10 [Caudoviricetes sp.]